jgi:hypothetical protein
MLAVTAAALSAQTTWLQPDLEVVLARQLTSRLSKIGAAPVWEEGGISRAARGSIRILARTLGSWTDAQVVGKAPSFPDITLPRANQRHIDAMARYQVCSVVLLSQFESGRDVERRRNGALGVTAMTMAVERLRLPFMATGGTDKDLHAFLTSSPMVSALDDVRKKPELAAHVERQCSPVLQELLFKAGL